MLPGIKQFEMTGKTAIVTGGSKGLGKAMAEGLASAGADVVLVARNEEEVTAYVDHIQPFLMGYRVLLSLGSFPIKEYIYKLNNFYIEEQKFEIEIIDGIDFKASKYFDISINRWNLDKLVPSVLEAHRRCKQLKQAKL